MAPKRALKRKKDGLEELNNIEECFQKNWVLNFKIKKPFHLNEIHKAFYDCIKDNNTNMVFVDGAAGTAKSYLAVLAGLELIKDKQKESIIYIRSVIESASRSIGALPGEIDDKFLPYAAPLIEKITELTDSSTAAMLKQSDIIHAIPVNFVRGLTFNNSFVVVDEAQNLSESELVTILTRFGKDTKYVICGDSKQCDIGKLSGFKTIFDKFDNKKCIDHEIYTFKFGESEIVRSKILRFIVDVLEAKH